MTEFTAEEWESRTLTFDALLEIAWDMILMAIYLLGGWSFLAMSVRVTPYDVEYWGYVAVAIWLVQMAIFGKFMRLTKPRDHYTVEIKTPERPQRFGDAMTTTHDREGFTFHELIFAMVFAFLMMGIQFGMLDQKLLQELSYCASGCFFMIMVLAWIMQRKIKESNEGGSYIAPLILMVLIGTVIIGMCLYTHDRQANPPEDFCHDIGENHGEGSSLAHAIVLNQGQCIKNETGFHANGKAWFQ